MIAASDIEDRLRTKYNELALEEFKHLREKLIGSRALLKHMPMMIVGHGSRADLKTLVLGCEPGDYTVEEAFFCMGDYLFQVTVGVVALTHRGCWHDGSSKEAAPSSDDGSGATTLTNWDLFKEALAVAATESLVEVLRKTKPDWELFDYILYRDREDRLKGVDEWSLDNTEDLLNELHQDLMGIFESSSHDFDTFYHIFSSVPIEVVMKAFDTVPVLATSMKRDPFSEHVRVRGQWVLEEIARTMRNEGNELFKIGSALTGEAQIEKWEEAEKKYALAVCRTEEDAVTNTNLAALHLAQKQYRNAIDVAQTALLREEMTETPQRFEAGRQWVEATLSGDESRAELDESDWDRSPFLKPYNHEAIMFKACIRSGRAHAALFEAGIKGEKVDTDADGEAEEGPWSHLFGAYEDYRDALQCKDEDASVPHKELKRLHQVFKWALKADDGTNDIEDFVHRFRELTF